MTKEYIERGALEAKAVYMHGFGKNKYVPLKAIQQAPAADVAEVKHGRWILTREYNDVLDMEVAKYTCSVCQEYRLSATNLSQATNYCPNCGADMRGE